MARRRLVVRTAALSAAFATAVAACSGDGVTSTPVDPPPTITAASSVPTTAAESDNATPSSSDTVAGTSPEPVIRIDDNPGVDLGQFNINRVAMDATMIHLTWTSVEGEDVTHRLYRFDDLIMDPDTVPLSSDRLVYEGPSLEVVDTSMASGEFHTYVLRIESDGQSSAQRAWAQTYAVTDTTPPTPIVGLTGEVTADGVLLSWQPSSDDTEFGAYAVYSVDADGQLQYIGGGAHESLTSFIDNQPDQGPNTYMVQAADFHDNRTELLEITVEVP